MRRHYSVSEEDVGNVVALEHVNLTVPDPRVADLFYVLGLGLTRDPYMMVGPTNMWINVGEQQFHLPTRSAQVLPGTIGLVVPDLDALRRRLQEVDGDLAHTKFAWSSTEGQVSITGPWGNHFRCHGAGGEFGSMALGISYVQVLVKLGVVEGIARFYRQLVGAPSVVEDGGSGRVARINVGVGQTLRFVETDDLIPEYDGHHIAVYVANVSKGYAALAKRGLIMQEIGGHQYRFKNIVDPKTGQLLAELEHEVRSMYHPMYRRQLVNRDPTLNIRTYVRNREELSPVGG